VALLNAAGGLVVAGHAASLRDGIDMAARAVDEGRAAETLERLVAVSNRDGTAPIPEPAFAGRSA